MANDTARKRDRAPAAHWWRFVPSTPLMGYVALLVAFLLLVQALSALIVRDDLSARGITMECLLAAAAVGWMVSGVVGLRILRRRRGTGH